MQHLIQQEQFELEVLDRLNSRQFLRNLVLGGGTMLRLCYGLNRFSVDLDFWVVRVLDFKQLFANLKAYLAEFYSLRDAAQKFHTLLFEIRGRGYPRSLKIEIRKSVKKVKTEQAIAFSPHSSTQVLLTVVSLEEMLEAKVEAFLARKEIRDVFDLEFLVKRGISLTLSETTRKQLVQAIDALPRRDYTVKLASILDPGERKYYVGENFKILKGALLAQGTREPTKGALGK